MRFFIALLFVLFTAPVFAQQQPPDSAFMQRALGALQAQRNQAMDVAASSEARAAGLADELSKAKDHIKELEAKTDEKKK